MSALDIMVRAKTLERDWDIAPFVSRAMVCDILTAIQLAKRED